MVESGADLDYVVSIFSNFWTVRRLCVYLNFDGLRMDLAIFRTLGIDAKLSVFVLAKAENLTAHGCGQRVERS